MTCKRATLSKLSVVALILLAPAAASLLAIPAGVRGRASGSSTIPAGEYAGQPFNAEITGKYSDIGNFTLFDGSATVEIGGELFESVVITDPTLGLSFCCGEGHTTETSFSMTGQVRHVTAAVPHNHLFGASATSDGTMCIDIVDQTGSVVDSEPHHNPGVGLICGIPARVRIRVYSRSTV